VEQTGSLRRIRHFQQLVDFAAENDCNNRTKTGTRGAPLAAQQHGLGVQRDFRLGEPGLESVVAPTPPVHAGWRRRKGANPDNAGPARCTVFL